MIMKFDKPSQPKETKDNSHETHGKLFLSK